MKFKTIDELIEFEQGLEYVKESDLNLSDYKLSSGLKSKYERLRNRKVFGVYGEKIVSVVSQYFTPISVNEIVESCNKVFGNSYKDKSFKQGIVRIYKNGLEDETGKTSPIAIFPANLGNMAVTIGVYHNASICSNGSFYTDNQISHRIIHRTGLKLLENDIKRVSDKLGIVMKKIDSSKSIHVGEGMQLAMIVQGLSKKETLIKKALSKYYPETDTLWDTIQTITYVSTHETKNGFEHSQKAGDYLLEGKLSPSKVLDALNYVFKKEERNRINFEKSKKLYTLGVNELTSILA